MRERVQDVSCECMCVICLKNMLPVFEDLDLGSGQGQNQEGVGPLVVALETGNKQYSYTCMHMYVCLYVNL